MPGNLTNKLMRSSKSRSRNKSNRQRSLGNIVNRVFDSSGPEGKVRGTPQQIIEKYLTLARDAQLSNDRVAEQSFLQHAEHYTRLLGEAQREQAERQSQFTQNRDDDQRDDQGQNAGEGRDSGHGGGHEHGNGNGNGNGGGNHNRDRQNRDHYQQQPRHEPAPAPVAPVAEPASPVESGLPPVIATGDDAGPVETPEAEQPFVAAAEEQSPAPRARTPRARAPQAEPASEEVAAAANEDKPADKPARRPAARRPAAPRTRKKVDGAEATAKEASNEAPGQ